MANRLGAGFVVAHATASERILERSTGQVYAPERDIQDAWDEFCPRRPREPERGSRRAGPGERRAMTRRPGAIVAGDRLPAIREKDKEAREKD